MTNIDETLKKHRSYVRVVVTYFAVAFVFFGGGLMIAYFILTGTLAGTDSTNNFAMAKDIFTAVLPIGATVVSFWFAGRAYEKKANSQNLNNNGGQQRTPQS